MIQYWRLIELGVKNMLKNLKKLFSVEEEDLEVDHKKITDEHYEAFKNGLKQFNLDKTTNDFNDIRKIHDSSVGNLEDENLRVREIDDGHVSQETVRHNEVIGGRKNFDFEKEIDKAYDEAPIERRAVKFVEPKPSIPDNEHSAALVEKNDNNNKRVYDVKELAINPDDYVLRDIISPMKGIVRKEMNPVVNKPIENLQKKSKIIKIKELRNQVDISEIDGAKAKKKVKAVVKEEVIEELPAEVEKGLPFEALENPPLQTKANSTETSRFRIVEDSTGEMRLFTDGQEE